MYRRAIWRFPSDRSYAVKLERQPNGVYVVNEQTYGPDGPDLVDPDAPGNWANYPPPLGDKAVGDYEARVRRQTVHFGREPGTRIAG